MMRAIELPSLDITAPPCKWAKEKYILIFCTKDSKRSSKFNFKILHLTYKSRADGSADFRSAEVAYCPYENPTMASTAPELFKNI